MPVTVDDIIEKPFSFRQREDKLRIIAEGKPRPFLKVAAVVSAIKVETKSGPEMLTHQFDPAMYDNTHWLTGCEKRNAFFCWPCLLFKPPLGLWNSIGVTDLTYLLEGMSEHEASVDHITAALQLQLLVKLNNEQPVMDVSQHNELVKRNRSVLKRLTDVVCNILFKEQHYYIRKKGCQLDPNDCVKNLLYMRPYDVLNCNFIEEAIDLIKMTPNVIDDLVDIFAKIVKLAVRKEIQASTFVSLILSDHSKISSKSQISTVVRYVKDCKVYERFIGFMNMGDQRSPTVVLQHIVNTVVEFGIAEKILAISLDGGILPTSELSELLELVKKSYPNVFFAPWYCHGVDYVLLQSLTSIKECSVFLKAINEIKTFFQKKSKRFKSFETFMHSNLPSLKKTKWFIRSQFIQVVNTYREYFVMFFESILQNPATWEADDVTKALGFQQILGDFQTIFLLCAFTKLNNITTPLAKNFKSANTENIFACKVVPDIIAQLSNERDTGFQELWVRAHSEKHANLPGPSPVTIKPDFDDPKIPAYTELYCSIVNCVIREIVVRYLRLDKLKFCQLLCCDKYGNFLFSNVLLKLLMSECAIHFDEERLKNELIVLRTNGKVFSKKTVHDLLDFFIKMKLKSGFKSLFRLAELILTLPVQPPTEESDFESKLDEIKVWSYVPDVLGMQTGDVGIPCAEMDLFQELKKESTFHDDVSQLFYEVNKTLELMPQ